MVRSIGIDPGDQAVKVVELDGNYKKTRLLRVHVAPASAPPSDGGTHSDVVAVAAREALDQGMRGDETLGHPCREAVLRTIELPFQGHDAIRKVVKSEIEGEIQSASVDDMVVDFHEIGPGTAGGTRVMVVSVPKSGLRDQLAALRAHKIEPESIDLDTMALYRAAHWAGAFEPREGEAEPAAAQPKPVSVVIDLGARSVKVLLVEGENLVEMRVLRIGDGAVGDEIARKHGLDATTARNAAWSCLSSGADQRLEVPSAVPATTDNEGEPATASAPPRPVTVRHAEVEAAHTAWLQRLARELTRFLTASGRASALRMVWVTGGASRLPGTNEMLAAVFGVPVQELDLLARLQHDLAPEQAADLGPRLATALGLALRRFGGPDGFELRQEDLTLTRGFERVKFPLAITCMVALLAMMVWWNQKQRELGLLEFKIGSTFTGNPDPKAEKQFYGGLNAVFATDWFKNQFRIEQKAGKDYTHKDLLEELAKTPVHKRLQLVRDKLREMADKKQKESGIYEDVSLESGLAVLVRWAEMMRPAEPQPGAEGRLGRYVITSVHLNMKADNNAKSLASRRLEFTIAFRGSDFRTRREELQRMIEAEIARPDSPFAAPDSPSTAKDEEIFRDSKDTGIEGAYFRVTMYVKDTFDPFGASVGDRIGLAPMPSTSTKDNPVATGGGK
jgi:Tfp pilus assembly PilM family ATPase